MNSTPETEPCHDEADDAVIGRALRGSLAVFLLLALVGGAVAFMFARPEKQGPDQITDVDLPDVRSTTVTTAPTIRFTDISAAAGLDFEHANGAAGEKMLPETMGGGCAFLDYDNDGDQDLLLVNSCHWPWQDVPAGGQPRSALYRNDGQGVFTNVAADVGLDFSCYGMGVAVGDYDNDDWIDIFITAVGENRLYHNVEGKFTEVTESAEVAGDDATWSSSTAMVDIDNDGDLDLFVCNYVTWSRETDIAQGFQLTGVGRAYGPPTSFEGTYPYLYRNDGNGKFTDISAQSGMQQQNVSTGVPLAKSLGVAPVDIDRDGWIDLVVANDTVRNLVFHNQGNGTFEEVGMEAGLAFDSSGKARGAMGIDAAMFRNDGTLGVAIANFANEMTALYVSSDVGMLFTDDAIPTGLGPPTRLELTFGLFFFDFDLDGRLDLLSANGHLENEINQVQQSQQYRQPARLFWNAGADQSSEFVAVGPEKAGSDLFQPIVGRGAAYADIDGDGDLDVLLTQIGGPPVLLRNDQQTGNHFLRFELRSDQGNRRAVGAWIEVRRRDEVIQRQVMPARSYLSQVELPVTIGLGQSKTVDSIKVTWPDGTTQAVTGYDLDGLTVVKKP